MLSLAYELEREIEIANEIYPVDLSYDNVIRVLDLLHDESFDDAEKVVLAMKMLLDCLPKCDYEELQQAFLEIIENLIYPETESKSKVDLQGNLIPEPNKKQNYSFEHDADYIYSSFIQAYGIDLIDVRGELDWAKFNALLIGLPNETKFKQVIEIRERPYATGKNVQKENQELRELKRIYALPEEQKGGG